MATVTIEMPVYPHESSTNLGPSRSASTKISSRIVTAESSTVHLTAQANDVRRSSDIATPPSVNEVPREVVVEAPVKTFRANLIIFQVSLINLLMSMSTGIVVVGLPHIASSLALPERLYLWPSSVYGLTTGSTLLLAGSIADVVGPRKVDLIGCFMLGIFTLACGLSRTGLELVMFRAMQGIAMAMHTPCSVSLVSKFVPSGKRRNIGFACLGLSMTMGYALGLVIGGVLLDTIGWRVGFYISGSITLLLTFTGTKLFPVDDPVPNVWATLKKEIDWIGASIACTSLAMFSYVLAVVSTDINNIRLASTIALLVISIVLVPLFPVWMHRQTKLGKPALIPNILWKNLPFTTVCILSILLWGEGNSMELFSSLYFQEVQLFSPIQASFRLLPALIMGTLLNFFTGYFLNRASPFWVVLIATILSAGAPLIMALIQPTWPYWWGAFPAQILAPLAGDILFTIGLIIVSEGFPERTQGLAGAVYSTVAYFGWAFGINTMQVVSLLVTKGTSYRDKSTPPALLQGYRASFWAMFAILLAASLIVIGGLRKVGRVGLKRD